MSAAPSGPSGTGADRWNRYRALSLHERALGLSLDLSAMPFSRADLDAMDGALTAAVEAMAKLEAGAIANVDENRMVGHYWLRAASLAPEASLRDAIDEAREATLKLAADVREGRLTPEKADRFTAAVVVGIGGSSLGPMLVCDALGTEDGVEVSFLDNTDPDGADRMIARLDLATTLVVVISKSGGTKETRNGMLEMKSAYEAAGLAFGRHAVAVTSSGSKLDAVADAEGFLARLPMWDWVGGRTSVTSAVGLLPAALAGVDVPALLAGAAEMDALTRRAWSDNPAAWLAAAWRLAGDRAMVMLPYKDRLQLISRYLQQLVMESIGKKLDLDGQVVHTGITVYGNKGSTDQHAYVQQLLDGPDDFFATFIEVRRDRAGSSIEVEPGVTSGDYLFGFLRGTREALLDRGRGSVTLSIPAVDARRVGAIIALYERAVGLYATLVNINAYHQPAVESGKKAAARVLALQGAVVSAMGREPKSAEDLAEAAGSDDVETVAAILRHLAENGRAEVTGGPAPWDQRFRAPEA